MFLYFVDSNRKSEAFFDVGENIGWQKGSLLVCGDS